MNRQPTYRAEPLDITMAIEELSLDGQISLGKCSRSTAYRNKKRINEYLADNKYPWRVDIIIDKTVLWPYGLQVINS